MPEQPYRQDAGFVLIYCLLIMLILTIIGIVATTNTSTELQIAGNDKVHQKTFYEAEAGAVLGSEVLEQGFNCAIGFSKTGTDGTTNLDYRDLPNANPTIRVLGQNGDLVLSNNDPPAANDIGNRSKADVVHPIANLASGTEAGYIYMGGSTSMLLGGALQMAAGYEGKGKAAGQGGAAKNFNIYSMFKGLNNSESIIEFGWRHLVGSEGTCIY